MYAKVLQVVFSAKQERTSESVPLNSAGASIFVALPSAFVALSSGTLQRLQPTGRLRIISAGAFHNLFAWTSLYLLGWIGIGPVILSAGYRDISQYGRLVVSLDDVRVSSYAPALALSRS